MKLAQKSGPQIAAKVGNPAGLLCRRIWYSVGKSGVLGITEYRQGRPLVRRRLKPQISIAKSVYVYIRTGVATVLGFRTYIYVRKG